MRLLAVKRADPEQGRIEEMCFAREILEPEDFDLEADLATLAYLDYRYMTPYERTEAFMLAYQKWYAIKQRDSRGRVGRRVQRAHLSAWPDARITMFWRARQHADALGVPYGRYIIAAMNKASDDGTSELPAPNQLYSDDVVAHVSKQLAGLFKSGTIPLLPRDCNPRFFSENYTGDPVQRGALDAIEADIRKTGKVNQAARLARYMRESRLISEDEARCRLGDDLVDAALGERLSNPVRPDQPLDEGVATRPGCFGYYRSTPNTMCGSCPVVTACIERSAVVDRVLLERYGTLDIRGLRNREGDRKRKQRERDRKRAGMTMTLQEERRVLRELGNPKLKQKRLKAKERRDGKKAKKQEVPAPEHGGTKSESQPELEPQPQG
ncbi:hypothetical protein [Lysobacter sp. FW306-1B-D06B]|uniref:hypothetical protein n=1 Tax=Lysobacter sp. FW306-1B-D06B TaxID=3140250 RepID=UPI0031402793